MSICKNCGVELESDMQYCPLCGVRVSDMESGKITDTEGQHEFNGSMTQTQKVYMGNHFHYIALNGVSQPIYY